MAMLSLIVGSEKWNVTHDTREAGLKFGITSMTDPLESSSGTISNNVRADAAAKNSIG